MCLQISSVPIYATIREKNCKNLFWKQKGKETLKAGYGKEWDF